MNQWNISSLRDLLIPLKPAARERKQLSKWPGKAVCSAVSSRVRQSFRENFSSEGRKENICHVWYFLPRKADFSPCPVNVWIGLNQINQIANEIGLLAHVISKLKMAGLLCWVKSCWRNHICVLFGYEGGNHGKDYFKRLFIQSMELYECIVVFT